MFYSWERDFFVLIILKWIILIFEVTSVVLSLFITKMTVLNIYYFSCFNANVSFVTEGTL